MIQFYSPYIETALQLPESDSRHCTRVLRMTEGSEIEVVDGKGTRFRCRIIAADPRRTLVEIVERTALPPVWTQQIHIAVAPTKNNDRMEWLVEKLTEIGVNRITPLLCRHSERKELKTERLEKIAVAAMKQSLKAVLPAIDTMTPIKQVIASCRSAQRYIAYCDDAVERRLLAQCYQPGKDITVLIGPEGDFSPEEVAMALEAGFVPVTLGNNRLRTETAALVACDTCHIIDQLTHQ